MGGNLFKLGRRPKREYLEIEAEVCAVLDPLLGAGYRIPRYYATKPDFGDLDVVVSRGAIDALGGWDVFCQAIATQLGVTQTKSVGHVYSTVYREFQVDYFVRDPAVFEATSHYLSFNDVGNLLGKIYRRLGLKYGEDGLSYVFRRASRESYKRELLVSRDWPRILALIGLDVDEWEAGFATLEQAFAWVAASPYFSTAPYDTLSASTERRAKQRTTIRRFLDWLEREGLDQRYAYRDEADAYVPMIAAAFPEAELERALELERQREADAIVVRAKFGGALVREWIGLDGKQLGAFLRRFSRAYPFEALLAMEPDAIRAAVEGFPRES